MGLDVSLDAADKTLVLELLTDLRARATAAPAKASSLATTPAEPAAATCPPTMSPSEWRAVRAKEARAEEKEAARKEKARSELLAEEYKAELAAGRASASAQAKAKNASKGGTVRLTLCRLDKPADRKAVVLPRAADVVELLRVAKAKLKLKKAVSARRLEDGSAVRATNVLEDGCVVAVSAEGVPDDDVEAVEEGGDDSERQLTASVCEEAGGDGAAAAPSAGTSPFS